MVPADLISQRLGLAAQDPVMNFLCDYVSALVGLWISGDVPSALSPRQR